MWLQRPEDGARLACIQLWTAAQQIWTGSQQDSCLPGQPWCFQTMHQNRQPYCPHRQWCKNSLDALHSFGANLPVPTSPWSLPVYSPSICCPSRAIFVRCLKVADVAASWMCEIPSTHGEVGGQATHGEVGRQRKANVIDLPKKTNIILRYILAEYDTIIRDMGPCYIGNYGGPYGIEAREGQIHPVNNRPG